MSFLWSAAIPQFPLSIYAIRVWFFSRDRGDWVENFKMENGGGASERYEGKEGKIGGVMNKKKMKKNMQRLGGRGRGGLSLESFANAKAKNDSYNPSVISKFLDFSLLS